MSQKRNIECLVFQPISWDCCLDGVYNIEYFITYNILSLYKHSYNKRIDNYVTFKSFLTPTKYKLGIGLQS